MDSTPQRNDGPLDEAQMRLLLDADGRLKSLLFAARVARFNGWSLAVMAVLCVPFAFVSPASLVAAAVLAGFAYVELGSAQAARLLDAKGFARLAINQLAILIVVVAYCASQIHGALSGPGLEAEIARQMPDYEEQLDALNDPMVRESLGALGDGLSSLDEVFRTVVLLVYASVILLSALLQGGLFAYYRSRRRRLQDYLLETPEWVRQLQARRAGGS